MEVPRLGVNSELQLLVYATATAMPDLSRVYDLHHSSCRILNPLRDARDRTLDLTVPGQVRFCRATMGTPKHLELKGRGTFPPTSTESLAESS